MVLDGRQIAINIAEQRRHFQRTVLRVRLSRDRRDNEVVVFSRVVCDRDDGTATGARGKSSSGSTRERRGTVRATERVTEEEKVETGDCSEVAEADDRESLTKEQTRRERETYSERERQRTKEREKEVEKERECLTW